MWKIILNVALIGLPYLWKFIKTKWGSKIDDKLEEFIDGAVEKIDSATEKVKDK